MEVLRGAYERDRKKNNAKMMKAKNLYKSPDAILNIMLSGFTRSYPCTTIFNRICKISNIFLLVMILQFPPLHNHVM